MSGPDRSAFRPLLLFVYVTLAFAGVFAPVAGRVFAQPYPTGCLPSTPEGEAWLAEHMPEATHIEPNALARARALAEALSTSDASYVGGVLPSDARPSAADNSTLMYFPPVGDQGSSYACTPWAVCYYRNTFLQARDEGYNASSGDPTKLCSPSFVYPLVNKGTDGGCGFGDVGGVIHDSGCVSLATVPYDETYLTTWPTEAQWIEALPWRSLGGDSFLMYKEDGVEALKQQVANGFLANTELNVYGNLQYVYPSGGSGISNRVLYAPSGDPLGAHAITIVGYDDNRTYYDHRDATTYSGAFLVVNSWGPGWGWFNSTGTGSKGFFWLAYRAFFETLDDPWDDRWAGPWAYTSTDRPRYQPKLFAASGINHPVRKHLKYSGGIGPTDSPEYSSGSPLAHLLGGDLPITDEDRVVVDMTDGAHLIAPDLPKQVFVELFPGYTSELIARITSVDFFHDLDGDGLYGVVSSPEPVVMIYPGANGYVKAMVSTTSPSCLYVDDSNTSGPWDGTLENPYQTIQEGIDNAVAGEMVRVMAGTYHEGIVLTSNVAVIGSGPHVTTIDSENASEAVHADGIANGVLVGFAIVSGADHFALRSVDSTLTVRDCIITGSKSGFGAALSGSLHLVNCVADGNDRAGVWDSGTAELGVENCTIVNNALYGVGHWSTSSAAICDSIVWNNGDDLARGTGKFGVKCCNIEDGDFVGMYGTISADPLFVSGPHHDFYLSQVAAGQGADSPCLDTGSYGAATVDLDTATTRTDGVPDAGQADMGYHVRRPLWITDVYWYHAIGAVVVTFSSEMDVEYVVEAADADTYSDGLTWTTAETVMALGPETTVTDDLAANPLTHVFRFYRVRQAGTSDYAPQTVGVFGTELVVTATRKEFFFSTPLVPDPDHATPNDVLGPLPEWADADIEHYVHALGHCYVMNYYRSWTAHPLRSKPFEIEPCVGYRLLYTEETEGTIPLRLTGYVPEAAPSIFVGKACWAASNHWIACSMPRPTTLDDLGLVDAATPWNPVNLVRLRPHDAVVWTTYRYDTAGGYWYDVMNPGVAVNPAIACGEAVAFSRKSVLDLDDMLVFPTWYSSPPNE